MSEEELKRLELSGTIQERRLVAQVRLEQQAARQLSDVVARLHADPRTPASDPARLSEVIDQLGGPRLPRPIRQMPARFGGK